MPNSELTSSQEWVELWSWFFCMWLDVDRSYKFSQSFQLGECGQACQEWSETKSVISQKWVEVWNLFFVCG